MSFGHTPLNRYQLFVRSEMRRYITLTVTIMSLIGPGAAILFFYKAVSPARLLGTTIIPGYSIHLVAVLLVLSGLVALIPKVRDLGFGMGAATYGIILINALITFFFDGFHTAPFIFALPVLIWILIVASIENSKRNVNNP